LFSFPLPHVPAGVGAAKRPPGIEARKLAEYRVYKLNHVHTIVDGAWIDADDDAVAIAQALAMCGEATPYAEVWRRHRKVALVNYDGAKGSPFLTK
jgi:hypothetical protein